MGIEINEFRVASVWTQTLICDRPDSKTGPYAGRNDYEALVDRLRQTGPANGCDLPWLRDKPFAHRFWVNYLGEKNPGSIAPGQAWLAAVPLRATTPPLTIVLAKDLAGWAPANTVTDSRITAETFLYPFGVGLIISLTVKGALSADDWIELACSITGEKLQGTHYDGENFNVNLRALAQKSMTKLAAANFDPQADAAGLGDPFRIMTVVQGTGAPADAAPDKEIQRHVQVGATLQPNWATAKPGEFVVGRDLIDIRSAASPGDLVYATKRGRTIWSPSAFSAPPGRKNSLGCYHRNQVFAALQTDALCGLANAMFKRVQADRDQPAHLDDLAKIATATLPEMYLGKGTYRSKSIQKQIDDDDDMTDAMQCLVARYGGKAWPAATPAAAAKTPEAAATNL
jgi:hypothetical protein